MESKSGRLHLLPAHVRHMEGAPGGSHRLEMCIRDRGISYAEAEEFALSVYRQHILELPNEDTKAITEKAIRSWQSQVIVAHEGQKGAAESCQTDL